MGFLFRLFGSSSLKLSQKLGAYPLPDGDISPLYVFFGVKNTGGDEVEVSAVRVVPKGGGEPLAVEIKGEIPTRLAAGESVRYEVRARKLAEASRDAGHTGTPRLLFIVTDGGGRDHRHDFRPRVDEYISLKDG